MSLELVNTFGTLLTVAIIAATAVAAMVQLRHLRAGNQINAMLSIGNQIDTKAFSDAITLVRARLDSTLEDPAYRDYVRARNLGIALPAVSEEYRELHHAALLVGNLYEELGILVKNGVVDRDMLLDRYGFNISILWNAVSRWVGWVRATTGNNGIWENFEYLTVLAQDFMHERVSTYPKGVRRARNPHPVARAPGARHCMKFATDFFGECLYRQQESSPGIC